MVDQQETEVDAYLRYVEYQIIHNDYSRSMAVWTGSIVATLNIFIATYLASNIYVYLAIFGAIQLCALAYVLYKYHANLKKLHGSRLDYIIARANDALDKVNYK